LTLLPGALPTTSEVLTVVVNGEITRAVGRKTAGRTQVNLLPQSWECPVSLVEVPFKGK